MAAVTTVPVRFVPTLVEPFFLLEPSDGPVAPQELVRCRSQDCKQFCLELLGPDQVSRLQYRVIFVTAVGTWSDGALYCGWSAMSYPDSRSGPFNPGDCLLTRDPAGILRAALMGLIQALRDFRASPSRAGWKGLIIVTDNVDLITGLTHQFLDWLDHGFQTNEGRGPPVPHRQYFVNAFTECKRMFSRAENGRRIAFWQVEPGVATEATAKANRMRQMALNELRYVVPEGHEQ